MDIKGYRALTTKEIDLINEGKALAELVGNYIAKLKSERNPVMSGDPLVADQCWVAIGQTSLQQGFMALTRSIAQPTTF